MKFLVKLAVALTILLACASSAQEFPIGEYIDANGGLVVFKEDGIYEVSDNVDSEPVIFGKYEVAGNVLTISDNLFYCPNFVGKYRWALISKIGLNLEIINEECAGRGRLLKQGLTLFQD